MGVVIGETSEIEDNDVNILRKGNVSEEMIKELT